MPCPTRTQGCSSALLHQISAVQHISTYLEVSLTYELLPRSQKAFELCLDPVVLDWRRQGWERRTHTSLVVHSLCLYPIKYFQMQDTLALIPRASAPEFRLKFHACAKFITVCSCRFGMRKRWMARNASELSSSAFTCLLAALSCFLVTIPVIKLPGLALKGIVWNSFLKEVN